MRDISIHRSNSSLRTQSAEILLSMPAHEFSPAAPDPNRIKVHSIVDPATGLIRVIEARQAAELEEFFNAELIRSNDPAVDFVVNTGKNMGKRVDLLLGSMPDTFFSGQFARIKEQIVRHLGKADFVPLDLRGLSASNVAEVERFVRTLIEADQQRVILIR